MKIDTDKLFIKTIKKATEEPTYDEEALPYTLADDFASQIKDRGEDYYYEGYVKSVCKTKNKYVAKVSGGVGNIYDVEILVLDENTAEYSCNCPCTYPCKHEYAVIMAISEKDYTEIPLKPTIKEKEIDIETIIETIPAEEIKKYLLSPNVLNTVILPKESFEEYFRKYYPKPKYEFYYNNLYNELILDANYIRKIDSYINRARQYISTNEFNESFKIIKSIIEAYNDSNKLNFDDYAFDAISKIGIILRILYRKSNAELKKQITTWSNKLEKDNYYNNYYLEDLILSLK